MSQKRLNIIYHFIGILIFLLIPILFSPDFSTDLHFLVVSGFQEDFAFHFLLLLFFYVNYIYLIPKFYFNRNYFTYTLFLIFIFAFLFILPKTVFHFSDKLELGPPPPDFRIEMPMDAMDNPSRPFDFNRPPLRGIAIFNELKRVFQYILIVLLGVVLQINRRLKKAENDKIVTELAYLKSQINPHFLFNTLNSIYSLAIIGSNKTADAVVKLSGMMRYVLNDASKDWVSLDEEINYISNYIELQKIRFENAVNIDFSIEGDTDGKIVAPLLLIPFIENAFKYGVNAEQNSSIVIEISIKKTMLHVNIWNKKVDFTESTYDSHGIGIENTKSRLNLLYPNNHILSIQDTHESYNVSLILHFV